MSKRMHTVMIILALIIILGLVISCAASSSIVGRWQDTRQVTDYLEFISDGHVIADDGYQIVTGTYELVGDNYVKMKFSSLVGAFASLFGQDLWRVEISGNTMKLTRAGETSTFRRVK